MTPDDLRSRVRAVLEAPTESFVALVRVAGLDPKRAFRFADLRGVDLSGENLNGFDLRGADLSGAKMKGARLAGALVDQTSRITRTQISQLADEKSAVTKLEKALRLKRPASTKKIGLKDIKDRQLLVEFLSHQSRWRGVSRSRLTSVIIAIAQRGAHPLPFVQELLALGGFPYDPLHLIGGMWTFLLNIEDFQRLMISVSVRYPNVRDQLVQQFSKFVSHIANVPEAIEATEWLAVNPTLAATRSIGRYASTLEDCDILDEWVSSSRLLRRSASVVLAVSDFDLAYRWLVRQITDVGYVESDHFEAWDHLSVKAANAVQAKITLAGAIKHFQDMDPVYLENMLDRMLGHLNIFEALELLTIAPNNVIVGIERYVKIFEAITSQDTRLRFMLVARERPDFVSASDGDYSGHPFENSVENMLACFILSDVTVGKTHFSRQVPRYAVSLRDRHPDSFAEAYPFLTELIERRVRRGPAGYG